MQLKQLKLAGFKSFVEPTTIPFASQLVAVVGPNGCGKSNIIDAVRWVMGESSAKNLRGESMTDVIFNGSSNRKPIGQASVELIFDNSLGRLAGQYANYQEISVKRLVTRGGDSFYYLNGSRCRRRDITDIFLGTGAGARGYSIIGQDTISRLVEARPEELRGFLEEAAGVSKYKERRRETLQRIQQTRENLARVVDIQEELGKQLQRLERQAKAAQRYTELKKEARACKAEILALKWHETNIEQTGVNQTLNKLLLQQEQHRSSVIAMNNENVDLREKLHGVQEEFQQTQKQFYQLNTEIARLEENLQQLHREQQRLTTDKLQIETEVQNILSQLEHDNKALNVCEQTLTIIQSLLQTAQEKFNGRQQVLTDHQLSKVNWDKQWQQSQMAFQQAQHEEQATQMQLQHVQQRYQKTQLDLEKNHSEFTQLSVESLEIELKTLQKEHADLTTQYLNNKEKYQSAIEHSISYREQLTLVEQQLHQLQDKAKLLITEHAAMNAAQNALLRSVENTSTLPQWEKTPRLAEVITAPDKWLRACELVLGDSLHAIVLDSMETLWPVLADLTSQAMIFVQYSPSRNTSAVYPRLSDKVTGIMPCWIHRLDDIFAAENLAEALSWLPTLEDQQSVVTADGYWLGNGWARFDGWVEQDEKGLLARQQTLQKLSENIKQIQDEISDLQTKRDQTHTLLADKEREIHLLQQILSADQEALGSCDVKINQTGHTFEQTTLRRNNLADEYKDLELLLEELARQKMQIECNEQKITQLVKHQESQFQQLQVAKVVWEEELINSQHALDEAKDEFHQTELRYNRETLITQQLRDSIKRDQNQADILKERLIRIEQQYNQLGPCFADQNKTLKEKIMIHHQLDEKVAFQRQQAEDLQLQLSEKERFSQREEHQAKLVQETIQQEQLKQQELAIRAAHYQESLTEFNIEVHALLASISTEGTIAHRQQILDTLDEKIQRLGAINLLAIEEYETELARKQHLDEQYQDLINALATLDAAILKMDEETQLRLKATFDDVNQAFQALFPRLFQGGHARLELTCDNLLEAGVLVMAQPPGKRNGTIHLLSGGEKAMTAVALVFAIFQQNPSPFCMLDEVDAPLDEINVKRFCNVVKEMSEFVQFLFITHNKVTMELADHLIGVTMREPGVSRIVAVNVQEALDAIG